MGKVIMISSPVKNNLDLMIDKMAPAMNKGSIIIVHHATWGDLIDELDAEAINRDVIWLDSNSDSGCSYKGIKVYRSDDYPVGQWGIYL
jgi:hypothetical protein